MLPEESRFPVPFRNYIQKEGFHYVQFRDKRPLYCHHQSNRRTSKPPYHPKSASAGKPRWSQNMTGHLLRDAHKYPPLREYPGNHTR